MANEGNVAFYSKNYIENLSLGSAAQLPIVEKVQDITRKIGNNKSDTSSPISQDLLNLFKLLCFIQAWSDPIEAWSEIDDIERKKIRHLMKFKKNIHKPTRRLIHLGLYKSVSESLQQQCKQAVENIKDVKFIEQLLEKLEKSYTDTESSTKKKSLIKVVDEFLVYKKFEFPSEKEEFFLEAAKLITSFTRWPDRLFYGVGNAMGLTAALACGISTGGAIFVLLVGFSLPLGFVIPLSLLFFLAGTRANFQLFSQHIPRFFHDLYKAGAIKEFIKGLRLSRNKKFLLLPAGILSLSVGIAAAAIAYLEGTKMIALICPLLAAACPHLTVALLGILASALLIGLTIVMLKTFIGVLQSQFSWQEIKKDFKEKWQNLNWTKGLGYVFKVIVMAAAFFGLGYLDFTGTATLAGLLGWVAADGITLAAIIGDLPFTLKTALAWCNSLLNSSANTSSDSSKDIAYYFWKIVDFFALIINALGNAALVFTDSCVSRIASITCFMNSYASNRIQEDDSKLLQARMKATEKSLDSLKCTFFRQASPDTQPSKEATNDETLLTENCSIGVLSQGHL